MAGNLMNVNYGEEVPIENLVVGQQYIVDFTDCCVKGGFIGEFRGWYYDEQEEEDYRNDHGEEVPLFWKTARFTNGFEIDGWAWTPYLVKEHNATLESR